MKIQSFEQIQSWQKSKQLTVMLYKKLHLVKDHSFKDQLTRASVSIMNNIAEGFDRNTDTEFIHFLHIARGSLAEVKSMLYLAEEIEYIDKSDIENLLVICNEIGKLINGFIKSLKTTSDKRLATND